MKYRKYQIQVRWSDATAPNTLYRTTSEYNSKTTRPVTNESSGIEDSNSGGQAEREAEYLTNRRHNGHANSIGEGFDFDTWLTTNFSADQRDAAFKVLSLIFFKALVQSSVDSPGICIERAESQYGRR